jgi:signal transduction histidine kinase
MLSPLRVRLLAWYSLILTLVIATFAVTAGYLLWRSMVADVDERLQASAAGLAQGLRPAAEGGFDLDLPLEYQPTDAIGPAAAAPAPSPTYYAIWNAAGDVVDRSAVAFEIVRPSAPGLRTRDGRRELTVAAAGGALVLVGRDLAETREAVQAFAGIAVVAGLGALLIAVGGGWFLGAFSRLQRALESQRRFTTDASHELRTPLATMAAETEWALARPRTADEYRESVETCRRAMERMTRVVDRLLTLARADHDAIRLQRAPVPLEPVVREAVGLVYPLATRRGITIETKIDTATVEGDRERLTELVTNLCSNAVEYNRDGGRVTIEVWPEGGEACMRVTDSGLGISADDLPRIFERFYRPDASRDRHTGGAGLGLAIAKWIVDAHGGRITCSSTPGEGTAMLIRLPRLV